MSESRQHTLDGPLHGLRVVDLTHALAGPFCTMLLADLGAEVIKVEPPHGDGARRPGPYRPDDQLREFGGYFASVNRNKRSVVANLKTDEGRELVLALVEDADVLVENFTAGVLERLGLGYDVLATKNPRLVYATLRGFGDPAFGASPYADWPAFDIVAQAMGGFMSITGTAEGVPHKAGPGIGDIFPGTLLALGITSAVLHARQTGEGQHVDIAMYDAVLALCERIVHQYSFAGEVPRPQGNTHPLLCPFDVFRSADGYVCIAAPGDEHWRRLCELIGRRDLGEDPRFATPGGRVAHAPEIRAQITEWTQRHTNAEITALLGGKVPVGPVQDVAQIFADRHVHIRGMLAQVEHPGASGPVTIVNHPLKFSRTPAGVRFRAPRLGEHTDEIKSFIASRTAARGGS
jgi:crotonobetainyl-CoA:carnitine CoA-transferase CaiB-like acyl-CoA transferase